MDLKEIMQHLVGQTITEVTQSGYDNGLIIKTKEGNVLEYGYSSQEGLTFYNGEKISELS